MTACDVVKRAAIRVGIFLTLLLVAATVMSAPVPMPPAFKQQQEAEAFLRIYSKTVVCMNRATLAMMRHSATKDATLRFVGQSCGRGVYVFLTQIGGWSSLDAATFIDQMAVREVEARWVNL